MDTPEWILQPSPPNRPTEIFLAVEVGISPSCVWDGRDEGWTGQVYAGPYKTEVGTCSDLEPKHYRHDTQDEAWACAEVHAQLIAEQVMASRGGIFDCDTRGF